MTMTRHTKITSTNNSYCLVNMRPFRGFGREALVDLRCNVQLSRKRLVLPQMWFSGRPTQQVPAKVPPAGPYLSAARRSLSSRRRASADRGGRCRRSNLRRRAQLPVRCACCRPEIAGSARCEGIRRRMWEHVFVQICLVNDACGIATADSNNFDRGCLMPRRMPRVVRRIWRCLVC